MEEMYHKLCTRFMLKPYECNELKEYMIYYFSLDDKFEKIHPLCGVVDRSLKTAFGHTWKKMIAGGSTLAEFSTNYYNRIYDSLDILSNDELFVLCKYPHKKENEIPLLEVFDMLKLFKKIGYSIGNGNTLHLLDIDDAYMSEINHYFIRTLGGEYFA